MRGRHTPPTPLKRGVLICYFLFDNKWFRGVVGDTDLYFENEGMVELGRGRVRLKDKKRLKELARQ